VPKIASVEFENLFFRKLPAQVPHKTKITHAFWKHHKRVSTVQPGNTFHNSNRSTGPQVKRGSPHLCLSSVSWTCK